jgi:8-oxo-dGTP pyrophosphatase MutT (NUDIX family)
LQVYAVYYEASGRFLLGLKLAKGYFFYNSRTCQGALVPTGQPLNGGDNYALPGGKREGQEFVVAAAGREFFEETGIPIVALRSEEHLFSDAYGAAFFQVDLELFNKSAVGIIDVHLPAGLLAKDDVAAGRIAQYSQIRERFSGATLDNELATGYVWDVNDARDWSIIITWKDDPVIGWYYEILSYFKTVILRR